MPSGLQQLLLVVAAPSEARAVVGKAVRPWETVTVSDRVELIMSGVGKANAAGATARACDPSRHTGVISLGIGGALPGSGLSIGDVVIGTASAFADEGVLTEDGFEDLGERGFPPWGGEGSAVPADRVLARWTGEAVAVVAHRGVIATVSTCSGTDEMADEVLSRTGAIAEGMEGAAVGATAARLGVPFVEVRVISNDTGDRECQVWDLPGSLAKLGAVARGIIEAAGTLSVHRG